MSERVSNPTFEAIRDLFKPYEKHFSREHESEGPNYDDLQDDRPHARSTFVDLYPWKGGARLSLSVLENFPELVGELPASLAPLLKNKSLFDFASITAAQKKALAALIAALWERVQAAREMSPDDVYDVKLDREETELVLRRLVGKRKDVELRETKAACFVDLPAKTKLPPLLERRAKKGKTTLAFAKLTAGEYHALRTVLAG